MKQCKSEHLERIDPKPDTQNIRNTFRIAAKKDFIKIADYLLIGKPRSHFGVSRFNVIQLLSCMHSIFIIDGFMELIILNMRQFVL